MSTGETDDDEDGPEYAGLENALDKDGGKPRRPKKIPLRDLPPEEAKQHVISVLSGKNAYVARVGDDYMLLPPFTAFYPGFGKYLLNHTSFFENTLSAASEDALVAEPNIDALLFRNPAMAEDFAREYGLEFINRDNSMSQDDLTRFARSRFEVPGTDVHLDAEIYDPERMALRPGDSMLSSNLRPEDRPQVRARPPTMLDREALRTYELEQNECRMRCSDEEAADMLKRANVFLFQLEGYGSADKPEYVLFPPRLNPRLKWHLLVNDYVTDFIGQDPEQPMNAHVAGGIVVEQADLVGLMKRFGGHIETIENLQPITPEQLNQIMASRYPGKSPLSV